MPTRITESGPALTTADLRRAEVQLKTTFPEEYKQLMLRHNGGRVEPTVFDYRDAEGTQWGLILELFALRGGARGDLLDTHTLVQSRMPTTVVAIGRGPGGNLFVLGTQPGNAGKLYLWIHDLPGDVDEQDPSNLIFLANSLSEFLSSLRSEP